MVCLDTSFIIDVIGGSDKTKKIGKQLDESSEPIVVAAPTIMELIKGAELSNKAEYEKQKVNQFLLSLSILNLDKDSAILAGEIDAKLMRDGQPLETEDIMIAAITIRNNETLLTKNVKHFGRIKDLKIQSY